MDSIPREILYTIVEYLRPIQYISFAIAYRRVNNEMNTHFKDMYLKFLNDSVYKYRCTHTHRNKSYTRCNNCSYMWCWECYFRRKVICKYCFKKCIWCNELCNPCVANIIKIIPQLDTKDRLLLNEYLTASIYSEHVVDYHAARRRKEQLCEITRNH